MRKVGPAKMMMSCSANFASKGLRNWMAPFGNLEIPLQIRRCVSGMKTGYFYLDKIRKFLKKIFLNGRQKGIFA
jgi:hypothetical protein